MQDCATQKGTARPEVTVSACCRKGGWQVKRAGAPSPSEVHGAASTIHPLVCQQGPSQLPTLIRHPMLGVLAGWGPQC